MSFAIDILIQNVLTVVCLISYCFENTGHCILCDYPECQNDDYVSPEFLESVRAKVRRINNT